MLLARVVSWSDPKVLYMSLQPAPATDTRKTMKILCNVLTCQLIWAPLWPVVMYFSVVSKKIPLATKSTDK